MRRNLGPGDLGPDLDCAEVAGGFLVAAALIGRRPPPRPFAVEDIQVLDSCLARLCALSLSWRWKACHNHELCTPLLHSETSNEIHASCEKEPPEYEGQPCVRQV